MDFSCVIALLLVLTSEFLGFFSYRSFFSRDADRQKWHQLDPDYLETQFGTSAGSSGVSNAASIFKAISLFALLLPIVQVAWILSNGGRRHLTSFTAICLLGVSGGLCELIANLMTVGLRTVERWIYNSFNLHSWGNENDGSGYRVLELIHLMTNGMTIWVDALEWMCMFFIMVILFFMIRYEVNYNNSAFGTKFAGLGLAIGFLGLFEFIAELLRLRAFRVFAEVSLAISIINTWILLPIWLVVLGKQLSIVKTSFVDWTTMDQNDEHAGLQLVPEVDH